jgi:hypothetical protein
MNPTSTHRLTNVSGAFAAVPAIRHNFAVLREEQPHLLHLALNEAEALAWQTGFPALVFPELALEKANRVAEWHERQRSMRQPDWLPWSRNAARDDRQHADCLGSRAFADAPARLQSRSAHPFCTQLD